MHRLVGPDGVVHLSTKDANAVFHDTECERTDKRAYWAHMRLKNTDTPYPTCLRCIAAS